MHLLRCLAFVEAQIGCHLFGLYIDTHSNHLADDLSRNRACSFLSKVPSAHRQPMPVAAHLLDLLLKPQADWVSLSCSALLSGGSGSIHSADIRGSNEEISLVLHSLLHPCSLPSHRAAPVLLRSVSCRPGSVATNHQRVPRGSSEHTDLLGLPRSQGSVFPADPEAGTSWNSASSGFCYSVIPPPSPHHSSCHGTDQGTPGFC